MARMSSTALAPAPFSARAHLSALRRGAVVALLGLAGWTAVACSSSHRADERPRTIDAPEWTYLGSQTLPAAPVGQPRLPSSCYMD